VLFSTSTFLLIFLPLVLSGFYGIRRYLGFPLARLFLLLASLVFYGYWNPAYVLLILGSIVANLVIARHIVAPCPESPPDRNWLLFGILLNIGLLGYFKYSLFLANTVLAFMGETPLFLQITLPLAISFFTFQQVAFLVDAYKEPGLVAATSAENYALFVTFFPQLIAGPIVHHRALVPQLGENVLGIVSSRVFLLGVSIFLLGLFKKVMLADELQLLSGPVFERLANGEDLSPLKAWLGILVYTFRLYFDFSAYSDMAFGLALLFGVTLPVNFFSPYKAGNINETWQRWNITLGNFFGNYVFKPLGGRKRGHLVAVRNLMIIMLLSGMWHGAGWNYLLWGLMQGVAMGLGYIWPVLMVRLGWGKVRGLSWYRFAAIFLTFTFWVFSLVAFRVTNMDDVWTFYATLLSFDGAAAAQMIATFSQGATQLALAFTGAESFQQTRDFQSLFALLVCFPLVFLAPNVFQYFGVTRIGRIGRANVTPAQAFTVGLLAGLAIFKVLSGSASDFIYFAF
jgi:alginate O-acetyltransferase complex protein AlgI